MKYILTITLLFTSFFLYAGSTVPPVDKIYLNKITNADGKKSEWNSGDLTGWVDFKDLSARIRVAKFTNSYYYENDPSTVLNSVRTGIFFTFTNSENFSLGDEAIFEVKFLTQNQERFISHKSCYTEVVLGGVNKNRCTTDLVKHKIKISRSTDGSLRLKNDSDDYLSYGYRKSGSTEYFEVFSNIDMMTHWNINDANAVPYIILTALNAKSSTTTSAEAPAEIAKYTDVQNAAKIWDTYKPTVESYIRDSNRPDIRPALQVGVSFQGKHLEMGVTVTSDFDNTDVSVNAGVAINNSDIEVNASVMGFATDSLESITSGVSTTVSGEVGAVANIAGMLSYNEDNDLVGAGLSVGVGTSIDTDVSVTKGTTVYTTRKSNNISGSDRNNNRSDGYNDREGRTSRVDGESGRSIEY